MKVFVLVAVCTDDPDATPELFTDDEEAGRAASAITERLWTAWFGKAGRAYPGNWEDAMGTLYEQAGFYDSVSLTSHNVPLPPNAATVHERGCERCGKPAVVDDDGEWLCADCQMASQDGTLYTGEDLESDEDNEVTYTVIITRDTTESTTVHVEASDSDEAKDRALEHLAQMEAPVWEQDDNPGGDPYVTDVSLTDFQA